MHPEEQKIVSFLKQLSKLAFDAGFNDLIIVGVHPATTVVSRLGDPLLQKESEWMGELKDIVDLYVEDKRGQADYEGVGVVKH
jgi:hypothetical protein